MEDIGRDDILEMFYELYARIDRGDDLQGVTKGTAIIYNARVEDIGSDDVLEMFKLYELY